MTSKHRSNNIFSLMSTLNGNAWNMVKFQPMWGIPYVLFNFYLSLYMKSQGVTDRQIGYLISIGFVTGTIFSLFSGIITDRLGRRKTVLIFDLIAWPVTLFIYLISNNFWLFALGAITSSCARITAVPWNLMIVEESTDDQRVAAFNYSNIVIIGAGILTPIGGLLVKAYGLVQSERVFLIFAIVSMTAMMIIRHYRLVETKTGRERMEKYKDHKIDIKSLNVGKLYHKTFEVLKHNPAMVMVICIYILFNMYMPIGTFNSLYFAPYLSEFLGLDKSAISILGSVNSIVMLVIMIFINPILNKLNVVKNMLVSLIVQIIYLVMFITIPNNNFMGAVLSVTVFSLGYGIFIPYLNALMAKVTDGCEERAGIYSFTNTAISVISVIVASVSGNLYVLNPRSIYGVSMVLLIICFLLLILYRKKYDSKAVRENYMEGQVAEG